MTKGGNIEVLGGTTILGKDSGRDCIGEHEPGSHCGPNMRDEAGKFNPIEYWLKHCPIKQKKKKDEAFKAHTYSPIKRGIPFEPLVPLEITRVLKK